MWRRHRASNRQEVISKSNSRQETETKRVDKGFVEEAHPVDEYGEESAPFEDAFVDQDEALDGDLDFISFLRSGN